MGEKVRAEVGGPGATGGLRESGRAKNHRNGASTTSVAK